MSVHIIVKNNIVNEMEKYCEELHSSLLLPGIWQDYFEIFIYLNMKLFLEDIEYMCTFMPYDSMKNEIKIVSEALGDKFSNDIYLSVKEFCENNDETMISKLILQNYNKFSYRTLMAMRPVIYIKNTKFNLLKNLQFYKLVEGEIM
jgi:hypothetical protein